MSLLCFLKSSVLQPHWVTRATRSDPGLSPSCPLCLGNSFPQVFTRRTPDYASLVSFHVCLRVTLPSGLAPIPLSCSGAVLLPLCPSYSHIFPSSLFSTSVPSIYTHAGPFSGAAKGGHAAHKPMPTRATPITRGGVPSPRGDTSSLAGGSWES